MRDGGSLVQAPRGRRGLIDNSSHDASLLADDFYRDVKAPGRDTNALGDESGLAGRPCRNFYFPCFAAKKGVDQRLRFEFLEMS